MLEKTFPFAKPYYFKLITMLAYEPGILYTITTVANKEKRHQVKSETFILPFKLRTKNTLVNTHITCNKINDTSISHLKTGSCEMTFRSSSQAATL